MGGYAVHTKTVTPPSNDGLMSQLTDTDRALLSLHAQTWRFPGTLESAVFEATGLRLVASWQRVNVLIDSEAALVFAPVLVNRLRRVRAARLR